MALPDDEKSKAEIAKVLSAVVSAHEDAESKGIKKGKGGVSEMACQTGCGGTLRYSVASVNGHMHASCTTDDCVKWME